MTLSLIPGRVLDCYEFRQSVLPLYPTLEVNAGDTLEGLEHKAYENAIYVHYIQTPQSDPNGDGILRYSVQKLMNDDVTRRRIGANEALRFDDTKFKSYLFRKRRARN